MKSTTIDEFLGRKGSKTDQPFARRWPESSPAIDEFFNPKRVALNPAIGAASWPIGGRDRTARGRRSGLGAGRHRWVAGDGRFRSGRVGSGCMRVCVATGEKLKSENHTFSDENFVATGHAGNFQDFALFPKI